MGSANMVPWIRGVATLRALSRNNSNQKSDRRRDYCKCGRMRWYSGHRAGTVISLTFRVGADPLKGPPDLELPQPPPPIETSCRIEEKEADGVSPFISTFAGHTVPLSDVF